MEFLAIPGGDAAFLVAIAGIQHLVSATVDLVVRAVAVTTARFCAGNRIAR
jgi:hypothetical protein